MCVKRGVCMNRYCTIIGVVYIESLLLLSSYCTHVFTYTHTVRIPVYAYCADDWRCIYTYTYCTDVYIYMYTHYARCLHTHMYTLRVYIYICIHMYTRNVHIHVYALLYIYMYTRNVQMISVYAYCTQMIGGVYMERET